MEYELYMYSFLEFKKLAEMLKKYLELYLGDTIRPMSENENGFYGSCKLCSFVVNCNDEYDDEYYDFLEEDLGRRVNRYIRFQIFGRTDEEGIQLLMYVVGKFIKDIEGNVLLLDEDFIIVDKSKDGVIAKEQSYMEFPFDLLGVEYKLINL